MISLKAGIETTPVLCDGKVQQIINSVHVDLPTSVLVNNRLCRGALPPACRTGKPASEFKTVSEPRNTTAPRCMSLQRAKF